jgi:serine/threonine protein phosphatase 1
MSALPLPERHWVIGDVHGCADALERLLERIPADDRLVFVGDVINRGAAIEAAMQLVWGEVERGRAIWLQGNHERQLVTRLQRLDAESRRALAGTATYRQLGEAGCRRWMKRLSDLPLTYRGSGWVATHAGFDPQTWKPHLTIRMPFWHAYDGRFGDVVVGHTPGPEVRRINRVLLIDTGACYGGLLTAYCPETGQILQAKECAVPSLPARDSLVLPGARPS